MIAYCFKFYVNIASAPSRAFVWLHQLPIQILAGPRYVYVVCKHMCINLHDLWEPDNHHQKVCLMSRVCGLPPQPEIKRRRLALSSKQMQICFCEGKPVAKPWLRRGWYKIKPECLPDRMGMGKWLHTKDTWLVYEFADAPASAYQPFFSSPAISFVFVHFVGFIFCCGTKKNHPKTEPKRQGSLYYPFGGNQTIHIYGNFQGFPLL